MTTLSLKEVWKIYDGDVVAVKAVTFEVHSGEFVALLGPSGCGKSSTMRMIAGLESISRGEICFDDKVVNTLPPAERNVALAFESYALYSSLSVRENLEFPLRSRGISAVDMDCKIADIVDTFQIADLLNRRPSKLSGGQAQRVSLARALIRNPNVMLLDEPLSHLDYRLRTELRVRIRRIHDEQQTTTIYVTHDQEEAIALSDRIIVMNHSEVQQIGNVTQLWTTPKNRFVAGFLGDPAMNFIEIEVSDNRAKTAAGMLEKINCQAGITDTQMILGFRPEDVVISATVDVKSGLMGEISVNEFHGEKCVLTIETVSGQIKAMDAGDCPWQPGDKVVLQPLASCIHLFDRKSGEALQHGMEVAH